jgi:Asp-tRNA(Asn)/Glu-tRNA(Gln) amidotransferase A subunit family amidase
MARSAADCALILQAIAGFDFEDPTSAEVPAPNYAAGLERGIEGVRIGLPRGDFFDAKAIDAEVLAAVEAGAKHLESLGAVVSEVVFPDRAYYEDRGVFLAEAYAYHEERIKNQSDKIGPSVMSRVRGVEGATAIDYSRARFRQLEYKREVRRLFQDVDLLLMATTPSAALPFPQELDAIPAAQLARNTGTFNILGVPAISLPCGFTSDGLPIGMQLAGRWWEEALVLRAAHAYQQETYWHLRLPELA